MDELEWREPFLDGSDGSWDGFPRDKELLVRLRELGLLGAKCEVLPKEIGHLTLLRDINLNVNNLSTLPNEIGNLTKLTVLRVYKNQLISLPESIIALTNLTYLDLSLNSDLKLTFTQKKWIELLKSKGCEVQVDNDA